MYGQATYYPNPAMQTAQQRLQMMEAQYPQFANPPMGYPQVNTPYQPNQAASAIPIKGRPVSNEEEANAAMIDFDGSLFVFPDKAHNRIYTKQLGLDGNIVFNKYVLETPSEQTVSQPVENPVAYAKQEDFDRALKDIQERFTAIERRINNRERDKGGNKG